MTFIAYRKWWQRKWRVYVILPGGKWKRVFTAENREDAEELALDLSNMPKSPALELAYNKLK